ncbi:hypothetical protein D3C84_629940 [compost metagenome]
MLDQDEPRGERHAFDLWGGLGVLADRIGLVDSIGNYLAIGDTAHAGLVKDRSGAFVEMHAPMPQAVLAGGVVTIVGFGHVGQVLQWVYRCFSGLEWISPIDWFAVCHDVLPSP